MAEERSEGRDRISELPKDIKQKILCCLTTRDALSTCCLSSLWRYSWITLLPSFVFGFQFFLQFSKHLHSNHLSQNKKIRSLTSLFFDYDDCQSKYIVYVQWLEQILQTYMTNKEPLEVLEKLYLYVPKFRDSKIDAYACEVVSQWIWVAKQHNVKVFNYCTFNGGSCFSGILDSKTLTKLMLHGCSLICEKNVQIPINLPCLKELVLVNIDFGCRGRMLDILLSKCEGTLKNLQLVGGVGVKVLRLSSFSKLKYLKVMHILSLNRVEIDNATALQCLTLIKLKNNRCKVSMTSNSCNNLVELFVNGCAIRDDFFNNMAGFPHLKAVTLIDCPELMRIKITSSCLTELTVEKCPNLAHIELNTLKMKFFSYRTTRNILTLLSKCQIFRVVLVLKRPRVANFDHILWLSKLVALLANFSHSTNLHFETNSNEDLIIPQELREMFRPPLCRVQNLSVTVETYLTNDDVLQHLDTLLWLSPHPKKIFLDDEDMDSSLSIELLYEEDKSKEEGSCCCCTAHPTNWWGCVLKDFEIIECSRLGNLNSITKLLEKVLKKSKANILP